jgi:hypothetical protein
MWDLCIFEIFRSDSGWSNFGVEENGLQSRGEQHLGEFPTLMSAAEFWAQSG